MALEANMDARSRNAEALRAQVRRRASSARIAWYALSRKWRVKNLPPDTSAPVSPSKI